MNHSDERNTHVPERYMRMCPSKWLSKFTSKCMWYSIYASHPSFSHRWRASPKLHFLITRGHSACDPYKEGRAAPSLYSTYHSLKSIAIIEIAFRIKTSWDEKPCQNEALPFLRFLPQCALRYETGCIIEHTICSKRKCSFSLLSSSNYLRVETKSVRRYNHGKRQVQLLICCTFDNDIRSQTLQGCLRWGSRMAFPL